MPSANNTFGKILFRQDTRSNLNASIRDHYLAFDLDSNHLVYSTSGVSFVDFAGLNEIQTLISSATGNLPNTGVSAGIYGGNTQIPVLNIDAKGRIISASFATVSASGGSGAIANSYYFQNVGWIISNSSAITNIVPGINAFGITDQSPGSIIKIEAAGQISWSALTDYITFNMTYGGSLLTNFTIAGSNLFSSKINNLYTWKLILEIIPQTNPGISASIVLNGLLKIWDDTTSTDFTFNEPATVNTNIINVFGNTVKWSNANTNNTLNIEEYRVYQLLENGETVTAITYQIDGGTPDAIYGGTYQIDGGSV